MYYYKIPILNGVFQGIEYDIIFEGVAFEHHVLSGSGYISTDKTLENFEEISEEDFFIESKGW
jgi:hypothetical protein